MDKKIIYMLIEDLFEDAEVIYPYYRMLEEGYEIKLVGPEGGKVYNGKQGISMIADMSISDASIKEAAGIIIPGGYAPDRMRRNKMMVKLVKETHQSCKVIAAICHGPWMLAEADIIRGKKVTGFFAIATDLKNAGGKYIDREVVVDENIITSRNPHDLPVFCRSFIELVEAYSLK